MIWCALNLLLRMLTSGCGPHHAGILVTRGANLGEVDTASNTSAVVQYSIFRNRLLRALLFLFSYSKVSRTRETLT